MTRQPHHTLPIAIPPANRFSILVVDDETPLRILVCRSLNRIGYTTVQAKSAEEAIEILDKGVKQPDLIISDVEMPQTTGIEMVRQIRGLAGFTASLPIIVASGNSNSEMRREALEAGADRFMAKPFELADLYTEVGTLLRKMQRTDKNNGPRLGNAVPPVANRLNADSPSEAV